MMCALEGPIFPHSKLTAVLGVETTIGDVIVVTSHKWYGVCYVSTFDPARLVNSRKEIKMRRSCRPIRNYPQLDIKGGN